MKKEAAQNRFHKGISSDVSELDRSPDLLLDAMNCRLTRLGDGLYAATIKGTEQAFRLTPGYIPFGATQYDGVLYIISHSFTDNLSEIGTYPSPNYTTTGYTRQYKPLQSFTTDNPSILEEDCTPIFDQLTLTNWRYDLNLDCSHAIRMIAREDFDGSVNLYWTDFINPIRTINTGFISSSGLYNNRFTTALQVNSGAINVVNESNYHPIIQLNDTVDGGHLKAGHYFFFVRYADLNYNATSFLSQSAPVPVFNERTPNIPYGGSPLSQTNKKAILEISNIDAVALFLEIGFAYYYSDTQYEAFLIDNRYRVGGNPSITVEITGNEKLIPLSIDELVAFKPTDALRAKDITQLNNILYMANTNGPELDHKDLRAFMCAISLTEDRTYTKTIADELPSNDQLYGLDEQDVNKKTGYFSSEAYVFGIVPVFKGGFVGRAYPVQGWDNFTGVEVNDNLQGVYRFSDATVNPFFNAGTATVKGIQYLTAGAAAIYNASAWLQDNLIGVYPVRGDRNPNLLYQGLGLRCYDGTFAQPASIDNKVMNNTPTTPTLDNVSKNFAPFFTARWHQVDAYWEGLPLLSDYGIEVTFKQNQPINPIQHILNKLGVLSLDYYIDGLDIPKQVHLRKLARYTGPSASIVMNYAGKSFTATDFSGATPASTLVGYNIPNWTVETVLKKNTEALNIKGFDTSPQQSFVSKYTEGDSTNGTGLFYYTRDISSSTKDDYLINLPIALPNYIAFPDVPSNGSTSVTQDPEFGVETWHRSLVNIYKSDPEVINYINLYDFKNTLFSPIGDFQPITQFIASNLTCYQGDCFVTRSYLKAIHGQESELGDEFIDILSRADYNFVSDGVRAEFSPPIEAPIEDLGKGWGYIISGVYEHKYNPNYRYEEGRNYFYPATQKNAGTGQHFAWFLDSPESNFNNKGYARMLSPRQILGIDTLEPITTNRFPTRIRPSITHVFGGVKDGYRQFVAGEQYDFNYAHGQINALIAFQDWLYSVQDTAINLHPINERSQATTDAGDTVITAQNNKLSSYKRTLSDQLGTQHQFSVILSGTGLHGIDFARKVWWRVQGESVENMGLTKGCEGFINSVLMSSSPLSDKLALLPDTHLCEQGIHGIYDSEHKEIWMTFFIGEQAHTLCFAEKIDNFQTRWIWTPRFYATIKDDTFSFNQGYMHLHDGNANHSYFYGRQEEWWIRWVVNAMGETFKHWDNLSINSNNRTFGRILYETQHQLAVQNPFMPTTQFWYQPEYRRNLWHLPIRRADTVQEPSLSLYAPESPMQGTSIITELGYAGNMPLWVREVLTYYHPHPKT